MQRKTNKPGRLVIVSNRLPFTFQHHEGEPELAPSTGGLVTGLTSYLESLAKGSTRHQEYLWVGWPGDTVPESLQPRVRAMGMDKHRALPVFLTTDAMDRFYHGFCNKTIWPLFHYFPTLTVYRQDYWDEYRQVNQLFSDAICDVLQPSDTVWIHDYHLMLLPGMLRSRFPTHPLGFFLHIPFPSFEVFRLLPGSWRRELLEGLLGSNLVGFHTFEYTQHFLQSVLRILGHDNNFGQVALPHRLVKADTFPMGIDFERYAAEAESPSTQKEQEKLDTVLGDTRLILSVDRLDYTKGILNRLEGFDALLTQFPEYRGKVVLVMIVVPSRVMVDQYDTMKRQIEGLVGKINGRFGSIGWTPVIYQYRYLPFSPLVAMYRRSDVALVTPLRDGMNLVAKEYVATRTDGSGVLILSEMAGAVKELGEAVVINPNNREEIATALREALEMPPEEQHRRMGIMRARLQRYTVNRWATDFVEQIFTMREIQGAYLAKLLKPASRDEILQSFHRATQRLVFLDYDGTLTPFARRPAMARPSRELLGLLNSLGNHPATTVVLVSGRDRGTLAQWFEGLPLHMVAEHGMWLRNLGGDWRVLKQQSNEWKSRILPILELYADRLPGAFVEEKEYSLVWHYRSADPEQSQTLVGEVKDHLVSFTANIDLQVLQGSKVIEIRNSGLNKGVAAREWFGGGAYDFIFAAGDDWTDEDLFAALPPSAHTIKVGVASTLASSNVRDPKDLLRILEAMAHPPEQPSEELKDERTSSATSCIAERPRDSRPPA
jgi:trehalose 6-phosphate synthase/phosphatase